MATIPTGQKFHTVASNVVTQERGSALTNSQREIFTMQDITDTVAAAIPPAPVLNTYPVTTSALAGTKFWYKGNEWHYMTQAEIDSIGWNGLVTVGFPAPVSKNYNSYILADGLKILFQSVATPNFSVLYENQTFTCDFLGLGDPTRARVALTTGVFSSTPYTISFRNENLLSNLEDFGTSQSFTARYGNLTDTAINQLFTNLPSTTKTATINVSNNPGSATCNPTIATSKGYIVVV
jgi:hypothetical protein